MSRLDTVLKVKEAVGIESASCDTCVYIEDVSDGIEYGGPCYVCSNPNRKHVSNLAAFPFSSDQICWIPNFWHSKFAKMIKNGEDEEVDDLTYQFRKAMDEARSKP